MDDILIAGYNEHALIDEGWHERSVDKRCGIIVRTTKSFATFSLQQRSFHTLLLLLVSGSPSLVGKPVSISLSSDGHKLGKAKLEDDGWHLLRFKLHGRRDTEVRFALEVDPVYIPHEKLNNGDYRVMGVNVAAARLTKE